MDLATISVMASLRSNPIRQSLRLAIFIRDSWTCVYCGCSVHAKARSYFDDRQATVDHVVSRANGGSNAASNLVTACRKCNRAKSDESVETVTDKATTRRIERWTKKKIDRKAGLAVQKKVYGNIGNT